VIAVLRHLCAQAACLQSRSMRGVWSQQRWRQQICQQGCHLSLWIQQFEFSPQHRIFIPFNNTSSDMYFHTLYTISCPWLWITVVSYLRQHHITTQVSRNNNSSSWTAWPLNMNWQIVPKCRHKTAILRCIKSQNTSNFNSCFCSVNTEWSVLYNRL